MDLCYPLWLSYEARAFKPKGPVWMTVYVKDSTERELRYARFSQHWNEAPIIYSDTSLRTECAQIAPRPRKTRVFDILTANGALRGSVSLQRGKTLKCTFYDAGAREIAAVHRASERRRSARLPLVYTLGCNGNIVWRLEYRLVESVLRIDLVQPLDESDADFLLSGLCAVIAQQRG